MRWEKTEKTVSPEGTTIKYQEVDGNLVIESRKRHIPHVNGKPGTWDHTSYWLIDGTEDIKEFWSLKDAKEYAIEYKEKQSNETNQ